MMTNKKNENSEEKEYIDEIEENDYIDGFGTVNNLKELRHQDTQKWIAYIVIGGYFATMLLFMILGYFGLNTEAYETITSNSGLLAAGVIGYYFGKSNQ